MAVAGRGAEGAGRPRQARPAAMRLAGVLLRAVALLVILPLAVATGGFLRFAREVAALPAPADVRAEGIVVLTGGRDRIAGALQLLAEGKAQRLLISGVHPATTAEAIERGTVADGRLFDCCVDLGRRAENTIGNASETRDWVARRGFRSLIVVTSTYHLPRSMAELRVALPGVALTPYPVRHHDLELDSWWQDGATLKVLTAEYGKYVVARLRLTAETAPGMRAAFVPR